VGVSAKQVAQYLRENGKYRGKSRKIIPSELAMGIHTELEHSGSRDVAKQIAMDHLQEDPHYYSHLLEMEAKYSKPVEKAVTFSGFKLQGRTRIHGMSISIENRKGSVRKGKDKDGHEWATKMHFAYGYIRGTVGKDKDHLDCYIGPNKDSEKVFIIHQNDPSTGKYDEDKVMLGFNSPTEAKEAYLKQYDRPGFFGSMQSVPIDVFKTEAFKASNKGKKLIITSMEKSRRMPIGSISPSGNYRKVKEGVWERVKDSTHSSKVLRYRSPGRIQSHVVTELNRMGFVTDTASSGMSDSKYIDVTDTDGRLYKKIRISDHDLPPSYDNVHGEYHFDIISNGSDRVGTEANATGYHNVLKYFATLSGQGLSLHDQRLLDVDDEQKKSAREYTTNRLNTYKELQERISSRDTKFKWISTNDSVLFERLNELRNKANSLTGEPRKKQLKKIKMILDGYPSHSPVGIQKSKSMPIGTVSNGRKKVAEGKWVPVPKGRGKQVTPETKKRTTSSKQVSGKTSGKTLYDLSAIKIKSARDHAEQAFKIASKYTKKFPAIASQNGMGKAYAMYSPSNDKIYVSTKINATGLEKIKKSVEVGYLSQDNAILHEMGHFIAYHSNEDGYDNLKNFNFTPSDRDTIRKEISWYAGNNGSEMMAEFLAGKMAGKKYSPGVHAIIRKAVYRGDFAGLLNE